MADTYNGLYLEPDWIPALLLLAPSELGRLIRCAIFYSSSGKAMDLPGKERVLWPYIHSQIDQRCSAPHGKKKAPADSEKKSETGGLGEALPSAAAPGQKTNFQASAVAEENSKKEREETSPIPPKEEIERSMSPLQNSSLHSSSSVSTESNINNINNISQLTKGPARFRPPTLEEVAAYCKERDNRVDPSRFLAYYESNGWRVGRNPMKDWKAAVRTWERTDPSPVKPTGKNVQTTPAPTVADQVKKYGSINDKMSAVLAAFPNLGGDL